MTAPSSIVSIKAQPAPLAINLQNDFHCFGYDLRLTTIVAGECDPGSSPVTTISKRLIIAIVANITAAVFGFPKSRVLPLQALALSHTSGPVG
jgi:hypothetical protein